MSGELVIALIASVILGPAMLYAVWYVTRGRHIRERRKALKREEKEVEEGKKDTRNMKWGVDKDSYCYPDINDVMGFEFVRVVQVDKELTGKKPLQSAVSKKWSESTGIGMMKATSSSFSSGRDGYEDIPDEEPAIEKNEQEEKRYEPVEDTGSSVSPEDLMAAQENERLGGFGGWSHRDENGKPNDLDLQMLAIMEDGQANNLIEEDPPESADYGPAMQQEALDAYLDAMNTIEEVHDNPTDFGNEFMRDLENGEEEEEAEDAELEPSVRIEEDDLPEI